MRVRIVDGPDLVARSLDHARLVGLLVSNVHVYVPGDDAHHVQQDADHVARVGGNDRRDGHVVAVRPARVLDHARLDGLHVPVGDVRVPRDNAQRAQQDADHVARVGGTDRQDGHVAAVRPARVLDHARLDGLHVPGRDVRVPRDNAQRAQQDADHVTRVGGIDRQTLTNPETTRSVPSKSQTMSPEWEESIAKTAMW